MNSIFAINIYKYGLVWAFTDDSRGLKHEPFVGPANAAIDSIVGDTDHATLLFSSSQFPNATHVAEHVREESCGNVYALNGEEFWLCPALLKFVNEPPKHIFVCHVVDSILRPRSQTRGRITQSLGLEVEE